MLKNITSLAILSFFAVIMAITIKSGIERSEVAECMKWQQQAQEIKNFYLMDWQKAQCDAHNVSIAIAK